METCVCFLSWVEVTEGARGMGRPFDVVSLIAHVYFHI